MKTNFKTDSHNPEHTKRKRKIYVKRRGEDEGGKERETQREQESRYTAN